MHSSECSGPTLARCSLMPLLARDLMEPNVLTIPVDMRFRDVQHLFVVTGCHGAPVVDGDGRVVGIVSAMDLLRVADQAFDEDLDPDEEEEPGVNTVTALELATPDPVWVPPDAPVEQIAHLLREHRIHRVLVGAPGELLGVVSAFDLTRALA